MDPPVAFVGESSTVFCFNKGRSGIVNCTSEGWSPSLSEFCSRKNCTDNFCENGICVEDGNLVHCECSSGFKQNTSEGPCEDIDECQMGYDLCSPGTSCQNTMGGYNCIYSNSDSSLELYPGDTWAENRTVPEQDFLFTNKSLVRKRCPIPTDRRGALTVYNQLYLLGAEVQVYCNSSSTLHNITCILGKDGEAKWDPDFDGCPSSDPQYLCLPPVIGKNVKYIPEKEFYHLNEAVNFSCIRGQLVGPSILRCVIYDFTDNSTGTTIKIPTFYGSSPSCVVDQCTAIKSVNAMNVTVNTPTGKEMFENGTIVTFSCDPEYNLQCDFEPCALECIGTRWNQTDNFSLPTCTASGCRVEGNEEIQPLSPEVPLGAPISFFCYDYYFDMDYIHDYIINYIINYIHKCIINRIYKYIINFTYKYIINYIHKCIINLTHRYIINYIHKCIINCIHKYIVDHIYKFIMGYIRVWYVSPSPIATNSSLQPLRLKRDVSQMTSKTCLQDWSKSTTVTVGSSVTLFCNLRPSCPNVRIKFIQNPSNRTLRSRCIDSSCFTMIDEVQGTDEGEVRCRVIDRDEKVLEEEIISLKISKEKGEPSWRRMISHTKPLVEFIFELDNNHHQWDKSQHWNFSNGNWSYLITPIIRVESETGIVHIQASEISENCEVELAFFTANYFISSVPEDKFNTILRLTSTNPSQSKTIKIIYSILWLMIKTNNCDHAVIKKLEITRVSCPQIQLGLTAYPTTTTSEIDILVIGNCVPHSSQESFRPQLVCSSEGKWKLGFDGRPPSGCYCNEGFSQIGHVCSQKGPVCYECPLGPIESCSLTSFRHCNPGEVCVTHLQKNNDVMLVEKKCSSECESNIKDLKNCLDESGSGPCKICCSSDYCNALPNGKRVASRSPDSPKCIDLQKMEVTCPRKIRVKKRHSTFSESVQVPWPRITDNDPHFRIFSNFPFNSDPYVFNGNDHQIRWTVIDKHNKISECNTEIIYEDYEEPEIFCPEIYIDMRKGTTSKHLDLRIPEIKTKDISPVQLVFSPLNGSMIEISKPVLINVTGIDSSGNLAQCQFWYIAMAADCPLWMVDTDQFLCTESENVTICYRRQPCTTRELPFEYKAIVCIPGHGWRFVQDNVPSNRLNEAPEMVRNPVCLEHHSSSITLSISFRTQDLQPACSKTFIASLTKEIDNFVTSHCPTTGWIFISKENAANNVSFNYSTSNQDTDVVLSCISEITESLARELPHAKVPCAPVIRSHTITYHVYCAPGWGANTNLKCEKCPPGYFATSELCVPCPQGTFSTISGANKCNPCGFGKSTSKEGADSEDECIPVCSPGYFSRSGIAPCLPCAKGSFQENPGQTSCVNCPSNLTTGKRGSRSLDECRSPCPAGSYSVASGGVGSCLPCPKGFYQESFGTSTCQPCPPGTTTLEEGASTRFYCISPSCEIIGCKNGGKCESQECHCPIGFSGFDCGVIIDLCNSAFCLNNSTCLTDNQGSKCICKNGFTGDRCEINLMNHINRIPGNSKNGTEYPREINGCSNGMYAENGSCVCNENYHINNNISCVLLDNGDYDYCMNGGSWVNGNCSCMKNFTGEQCHIFGSCQNDTECYPGFCAIYYNGNSNYIESVCVCPPNMTGEHCENYRSPNEIKCNNGVAVTYPPDSYCKCNSNFSGTSCEVFSNPCYYNNTYSCLNGGNCSLDGENISCHCPSEWTGSRCETPISSNCPGNNCNNRGNCVFNETSWICNCYYGYTGFDCSESIDSCKNYPENDSSICNSFECSSSPGYITDVSCSCSLPWSGPHCTEFEDPCRDNECGFGKCIYDFENQTKTCICDPHYKGSTCSEKIDFCSVPSICFNGGKCRNIDNGYNCDCVPGFFGENCESKNPCFEFNCNHGTCTQSSNGSVSCTCNLGYSGPKCDVKTSFCDKNGGDKYCSNHGHCVDQGDIGYCICNYDYMGTFCGTKKTRNYNILFTGIPPNSRIESLSPSSSSLSKEFTFCSWVRYNTGYNIETYSHRYKQILGQNASFLSLVSKDYTVIEMTIDRIYFNNRNYYLKFDKSLDGWHHVCIQNPSGGWSILVDARPVTANQNYNFGSLNIPGDTFKIVLGSIDNNTPFNGELSYVEIYDSILTPANIADMVYDCVNWSRSSDSATNRIISWNQFTTVPYGDPGLAINFPGICYYFSCPTGSLACVHTDKTPPKVLKCPDDQVIQTTDGFATANFNMTAEEMFKDDSIIIQFKSNYRTGQAFQIGQYRIIFIAVDAALNSASCEFLLTVTPAEEEEIVVPSDSTDFQRTYFTNSQLATGYGIPMCKIGHGVTSNNYAPFYVSDMMRRWDRFSSVYGTPFHAPECTPAKPPLMQKMYGSMDSGYNNCDDSKLALKSIISGAGFCNDTDCSNLQVKCDETKSGRFKRDMVPAVPMVFNLAVADNWNPVAKDVLREIKKNSNFQTVEAESDPLVCESTDYSIRYENETIVACAQAPRGYTVSNNQPSPCPENTYKDTTGNGICTSCGTNKITGGPGSTREEDCFDVCPPGSFYDFKTSSCAECPVGTYNSESGTLKCRPCPEGMSTGGKTGVNNVIECVPCDPGQELSASGACIDCKTGTYRNDTLQCVTCNRGFTTSGNGMKFPTDCNVIYCPPGMMKNSNATVSPINQVRNYIFDVCNPCGLGEYQPSSNSVSCLKCKDGKVTRKYGSISEDDCVDDAPCSPTTNAPCDEMEGGYTCDCTDGYCHCVVPHVKSNQSWWIILLICFFILLCVIVSMIIIWKKQLISNFWPRNPPNWMLKYLPKWLQEFLKGDLADMRADRIRRSNNNSLVDIPTAEFELREPKDNETDSIPSFEPESIENETALNEIRDGFRDIATPSPRQAIIPPIVPKPFKLQPPPSTTKVQMVPNFQLDVQSSQTSRQESNNIQCIETNNSREFRASAYSSKDMTDESYSIRVSQQPTPAYGPPASRYIALGAIRPQTPSLMQSGLRSPLEQPFGFPNMSSLASASLHRRDSSENSETFNYSDRRENDTSDPFVLSSRMIPGTADYFSQGMEMSEGISSARSLTSMSKKKGSFYSHRNNVDRRQPPQEESTDVDSDPDAFYS
ncbi:hypothetical protein FO519_003609 [Halicephalobus sp. NKZ332]|nr:hypothetical protein FO519_003609 [Halicephalobus sp. NKZ332]